MLSKHHNSKILIKIYKRMINNEFLRSTLVAMLNKKDNNSDVDKKIKDSIFNIDFDKAKEIPYSEPLVYEDIIKNLEESERILSLTNEKLKVIKESNLNLTLEIKNVDLKVAESKIKHLNSNKDFDQSEVTNINIHNIDNINTENTITNVKDSISNIKKNIFDISWLQPFLDFMHNNSSLVLTISGGLFIGGMWYFNNIGMINIGKLLSRLGINITSRFMQPINNLNTNIELPLSANINVEKPNGGQFFRELGKKVLEMIDIYIEKMKDKRQKYM